MTIGPNMHKYRSTYFPNLNGLRFLAALLVLIDHTEGLKLAFGLPNRSNWPFFYALGQLGVVLFFVLSGFLITWLLLAEERHTGGLSVKGISKNLYCDAMFYNKSLS
jgi:peptidoglycan/LPS O-acetylase OafA/YrhL